MKRFRERDILLPTYDQLAHPEKIPQEIKDELKKLGLWELHSRNLFRITWKNEPVEQGGGFGKVNCIELPSSLTGVKARIFVLIGKYFPTGAHKVGAAFGPLVEKVVQGHFDPTRHKALWPSTGNYCRGGAYDSWLMACPSIAVLPEGMSAERFEWLHKVQAEVHGTPGTESNVKEVFDETARLKRERPEEIVVLNQFHEFGNPMFHYHVTGRAMEEVFEEHKKTHPEARLFGTCLTQGSGGTLASGYYLKTIYPLFKLAAGEALQCPTLLWNGFGEHRIEGIGDKHVPWVINVKQLDMVVDIDDEPCMRLLRLFAEPAGQALLIERGVPKELVEKLGLLGISAIGNVLGTIKMAKYYELTENDVLITIATDSADMYRSRVEEARHLAPAYDRTAALVDFERWLLDVRTDTMLELSYYDKKRMHSLKYYTWIEQLGFSSKELNQQWFDEKYWTDIWAQAAKWDRLIVEFNHKTGLGQKYHL